MFLFSGGSRLESRLLTDPHNPFPYRSAIIAVETKASIVDSIEEPLQESSRKPKAIIHEFLLLALIWFAKQSLRKTCMNTKS